MTTLKEKEAVSLMGRASITIVSISYITSSFYPSCTLGIEEDGCWKWRIKNWTQVFYDIRG